MHDFKKLNVWQIAIDLVTEIYKITEIYGLTSQIRRSAVSIPSNISEGAGRKNDGEFKLFLGYAYGSCCELETQLIIAHNLEFIDVETLKKLTTKLAEIETMVFKLSQSIKQ